MRNGDTWELYRFGHHFGRDGFERGDYRFPGEGIRIETPRHRIYVHPG